MVRDQTAQACRPGTISLGQPSPCVCRQLLDRLADHLKVEQHRVEGGLVGDELLYGVPTRQSADLLGTGNHVVQIEQPTTRHGPDPRSTLPRPGLQTLARRQVDQPAQQFFEAVLEIEVAIERGRAIEVHQHIDIAVGAHFIAGGGSEQCQVPGAETR